MTDEIWTVGRCPGCTGWILLPLRDDGTLPAHDLLKILGTGTCDGTGERPYETMKWDPVREQKVEGAFSDDRNADGSWD